jgi:hypothetical protein
MCDVEELTITFREGVTPIGERWGECEIRGAGRGSRTTLALQGAPPHPPSPHLSNFIRLGLSAQHRTELNVPWYHTLRLTQELDLTQ